MKTLQTKVEKSFVVAGTNRVIEKGSIIERKLSEDVPGGGAASVNGVTDTIVSSGTELREKIGIGINVNVDAYVTVSGYRSATLDQPSPAKCVEIVIDESKFLEAVKDQIVAQLNAKYKGNYGDLEWSGETVFVPVPSDFRNFKI